MVINSLLISRNSDSIIIIIIIYQAVLSVLAPNIIHRILSEEFLKCNYEWW
jgi:hypothetical protein